MTTFESYESYLSTGSGSQQVQLTLGPETAHVVLRYRWMGIDDIPARCELRFAHRPLSAQHGLLELVWVAIADDDSTDPKPVPGPSEEQALLPLTIEYLRVPASAVHVHAESQLHAMRPTGYADWNETFELLLLADDTEGWPEAPLWEHVHGLLDKAKLAPAADA